MNHLNYRTKLFAKTFSNDNFEFLKLVIILNFILVRLTSKNFKTSYKEQTSV